MLILVMHVIYILSNLAWKMYQLMNTNQVLMAFLPSISIDILVNIDEEV